MRAKPRSHGDQPAADVTTRGSRLRTAAAICSQPANLRRTLPIALTVGILLTLINQLDVFIEGKTTALTWVKVGLNFCVPFAVSNLGVLAGTHTARR